MRIAALYDIHGNVPALDAVLREVREAGVDRLVIGGDILPGPMPRETIARLQQLELPVEFLRGNCELALLQQMGGAEPTAVPEAARPNIRWTAQHIDPEQRRWIESWPKTLRIVSPTLGDVLFCHATPRDETEIFTRQTPEDRLRPVFDGLGASIVVCGHTHMQFDRRIGGTRVINSGSVGMPFGAPGAFWTLLGEDIELRRTEYDREAAAGQLRESDYPGTADFVDNYLLNPPSEAKMLDLFGKAELK